MSHWPGLEGNGQGKLYAIDPHAPTNWNDSESVETFAILQQNLQTLGLNDVVEIVRKTSDQAPIGWKLPH